MTVDILIPFHGHTGLLRRCLQPLFVSRRQMPPDIRPSIFLVDDASPETLGPDRLYTIFRLSERTGFVGAINYAWSRTTGEIVILLNNDTIPTPTLVLNLATALKDNRRLAAAGPATDNPKDLFQYRSFQRKPVIKCLRATRYLTGACMALRRSAIKEDLLFDARYSPGYFEDLDLCCRLHTDGWQLAILEHEYLHHAGAATFGKGPGIMDIVQNNYTTFAARWGHLPGHRELNLHLWT